MYEAAYETAVIIAHDGTLFIEEQGKQKLNMPLLNALKGAGIKHLFLLPPDKFILSLRNKTQNYEPDPELTANLKQRGFTVQSVPSQKTPNMQDVENSKQNAEQAVIKMLQDKEINFLKYMKNLLCNAYIKKLREEQNSPFFDWLIFDDNHPVNIKDTDTYVTVASFEDKFPAAVQEELYASFILSHYHEFFEPYTNDYDDDINQHIDSFLEATSPIYTSNSRVNIKDLHLLNYTYNKTKEIFLNPESERLNKYEKLADKLSGKSSIWQKVANVMYSLTLGLLSVAKKVADTITEVEAAIKKKNQDADTIAEVEAAVKKKKSRRKMPSGAIKKVKRSTGNAATKIAYQLRSELITEQEKAAKQVQEFDFSSYQGNLRRD